MGRGRGCSITMLGLCGTGVNVPLSRDPLSGPQIVHDRLFGLWEIEPSPSHFSPGAAPDCRSQLGVAIGWPQGR